MNVPTMQELLEAGVHFGHQVRRGHPKMGEYIFGVRDGAHIINLELSEKLLQEAVKIAGDLGTSGKVLLFVGTKKQAQPIISELAQSAGAPYITFKWPGGLLTNFDEIRKNIKKLIDLKEKQSKGELSHYTKKEQLLIVKKLQKFDQAFGGIVNMDKLPDAIFLADCASEKTALAESRRMNIPVIGIADTNCNPMLVNFPIPGNDDATKSIRILSAPIALAYGDGLKEAAGTAKAEGAQEKTKEVDGTPVDEEISADVEAAEELVEKEEVKDAKIQE